MCDDNNRVQRAVMGRTRTNTGFRTLIRDMLAREPADRPSCDDIQIRVKQVVFYIDSFLPENSDLPVDAQVEQSLPLTVDAPMTTLGMYEIISEY